jgi:GNAT superfamily N-acetyltransferase
MTIRPATPKDAPIILNLIQDLAIYEKEPDAVKTTVADILRDGLDTNSPYFHVQLCEEQGHVKGFALYFFTWSTWEGRPSLFLEDLFVPESERRNGYGMALLKALAKIAVEKNCQRFEWQVLDWNKPARDFYHSIGAKHLKEWLPYRLEGEKLLQLAEDEPKEK